jgi:hypothetical protein
VTPYAPNREELIMSDIKAKFTNKYGESRKYTIWDEGRDPSSPPVVFAGYLDAGNATDWLTLQGNGSYGRVKYQRSDGSATTTDVTDGNNYDMN